MTQTPPQALKRVLITGAAGHIGGVLRVGLRGPYSLRLSDLQNISDLQAGEESLSADLSDPQAVERIVEGIDAVVHLGAIPTEDRMEHILTSNVTGTANLFEAARLAGVRRIVFASSIHAVGFYTVSDRVDSSVLPRPDTHYGLSKVYGEALGRLYFDKYGLEVACIRIGSFLERPREARNLATWLSYRDAVSLVRTLLDAPQLGYQIVYGISGNTRSYADNSAAFRLGYAPQDNAEDFAQELLQADDDEAISNALNGGVFTARDFKGRAR